MSHLLSFVLCLAGFTALAVAVRRQQRDVIGRFLPLATTYVLRVLGSCSVLLALVVLVASHGWSFGLVMFSGYTSIASGIVYCMLVGYSRMHSSPLRHR